ncbi:hypothetical protein ACES2L_15485 [Bdellovibrio bacteriovorus]
MNKISGKTNQTVVKIFINIITSASMLLYSPFVFAAETTTSTGAASGGVTINNSKSAEEIRAERDREERAQCAAAREKMTQAQNKIGELCRKAGGGGSSDCVRKAKECGSASSSESFDTVAAFGTVLGLPAGSTNVAGACPQWNGRDYFAEKDKIEDDIAETEKELAELNDDKAKIEKEYKKEMNDLQEALSKAQEEYKKRSLEIDEKERERIAEFHASQNQAKEEMRKKGSELLRLRGEMTKSQQNKAKEMLAISEAAGKRECMKNVTAARKNYEALSTSSNANHMAQAKRKKQDLINIYNECMSAFNDARKTLLANTRQAQDQLTKEMNDIQSNVDEIQNGLNLAASQLDEMKQASLKEKSDAVQAVIDLGTRTQTQMEAAYQNMQESLKTLAAKSQSLTAKLNRLNQNLMSLGPVPKRNAEYAIGEVGSEIDAQIDVLESIRNDSTICASVKDAAGEASDKYRDSRDGVK